MLERAYARQLLSYPTVPVTSTSSPAWKTDTTPVADAASRSVANIAETLEKETAELVNYLNDEVVPAVRTHSSKALRIAAGKISKFADFLETEHKGS